MGLFDKLLSGGLLGGVFDLASSITSSVVQKNENERSRDFSRDQQEDAQAFNSSEAQKQRDFNALLQEDAQAFNSAEAALNRDFQSAEAQKNREFQAAEAEAAFAREEEFYNQYQSIGAQMRQYREAGLNPALLAGGVSVGSTPSSPAAAGSTPSGATASSSPLSGAAASSSPLAAALNAIPQIAGLAQISASIAKTKAETQHIKEDTKLTFQKVLTEQQNTEVAKETASEIGVRKTIAVDRWSKESEQIDAEIQKIAAETETELAKKEHLIADKLLKEAMASYEKWKTDTAALRYWTSTGFYALASGLSNLVNAGVNVLNIKRLFKEGLQKSLKLPTEEVNLPNKVHKDDEHEFFDSLNEILESL